MSVITNTTVISNFAAIGKLELLHTLWNTLYISEQVYAEIQGGLYTDMTFMLA